MLIISRILGLTTGDMNETTGLKEAQILLTGETGLIGSSLVKRLVADGFILTCPIRIIEKAK